jgi:hypothetical protein
LERELLASQGDPDRYAEIVGQIRAAGFPNLAAELARIASVDPDDIAREFDIDLTAFAVHPDRSAGSDLAVYGWCITCNARGDYEGARFALGSSGLDQLVTGAREHLASDGHRRGTSAYRQGEHDQGAGTVDTTRTADRAYVGGLSARRTADLDTALAAGADPSTSTRPGRHT